MNTSYRVTSTAGELIALVAKTEDGSHWAELKALLATSPDAQVKPVVTIDNPCSRHCAFEADNCPSCGTSRMSF